MAESGNEFPLFNKSNSNYFGRHSGLQITWIEKHYEYLYSYGGWLEREQLFSRTVKFVPLME